jgi:hypothetical protein
VELVCINGRKDRAKYNNHYTIVGKPGLMVIVWGNCPIVVQLLYQMRFNANCPLTREFFFTLLAWTLRCTAGVRVTTFCLKYAEGDGTPRFFSTPQSPCPSIYPSPSYHPSIEAFEAPWILHNVSLIGCFL